LFSPKSNASEDNTFVGFRNAFLWLAIIPATWFAIFFLWPTLHALISLTSWSAIKETLSSQSTWSVLWFTTWQALMSVIATFLIAMPITWILARFSFPGSRWVRGIVSTPFVLPTVVVAGAVMSLLPLRYQFGAHGIIIAHVLFNIAVVVRIVGSRWQTIAPDIANSARVLGASPIRTFWYVTLPLLRQATLNTALIVFVFTFTSFGVVAVLGGIRRRTIEVEIYTNAINLGFFDTAMILAILQLFAVGVVFLLTTVISRQKLTYSTTSFLRLPLREHPRQRSLIAATAIFTTALIAFPFIALFIRSFRADNTWTLNAWRNLWNGSLERVGLDIPSVITRSLLFAVATAIIAVPMAYVVASLSTYTRRGGSIMRACASLPIVISSVTLGFGIIVTFDQSPYAWRGETWLLPVIHALIALPLLVHLLVPVLQAVPDTQRDAARTLGASPFKVWWHIDARSMRTPVMSASALSFAVSLGEFGATTFLSRSSSTTLPIAISQLLGRPGTTLQASGFALAALLAIVTAVVMSRA
jgi:thiamine transport system permease protein